MMKAFLFAAIALASASVFAGNADDSLRGDADAGKAKSGACAGCHGMDGNSAIPMNPNLAGLGERYIADQLAAFKRGKRKNPIMQGMVASLSQQDMLDLGAYYSHLPPKVGAANPDLVDQGRRLYRGGRVDDGIPSCMGCHGPAGKGNPAAGYPALSGQHAQYTGAQLKAFRNGQRIHNSMNAIARRMTDQDIDSLAGYIQGLY